MKTFIFFISLLYTFFFCYSQEIRTDIEYQVLKLNPEYIYFPRIDTAFSYSRYEMKKEYLFEGVKLNQNHLYVMRNDTVFSCIIFRDNSVDSIECIPVSEIKFFRDKNIKFIKCEPSDQFMRIKKIIRGDYECVPLGLDD
jgi:hypothetical protein